MNFSNNTKNLEDAKSIYINEKVYELKKKGKDIIVLSLGEAFFNLPNFKISKEAINLGYHYTNSSGFPPLCEKIIQYLKEYHHASDLKPGKNLVISSGSKILTYISMLLCLEKNSKVILHEPAWLSYGQQAYLCGATVKFVDYKVTCRNIYKEICKNTKLIIINNPNNPTGKIYSIDDLTNLIIEAKKNNVFVLIDEAYSDFVDDENFFSACGLVNSHNNLIVVNSLSKNFGMSGWRIGYAISCEDNIRKIKSLNQHLITCAPTILQAYVAENFDQLLVSSKNELSKLMKKRILVKELLDKYKLKYMDGNTTFYFFVNIKKDNKKVEKLVEDLLIMDGISVVPGSAYGKSTGSFIRISFGTESIDRIDHALSKIKNRLK